jgi:hypothetical protein
MATTAEASANTALAGIMGPRMAQHATLDRHLISQKPGIIRSLVLSIWSLVLS